MKVAVVTGGAGGIGLATAKRLGRDHLVVIGDVRQERLGKALAELQQLGIRCDGVHSDITDPGSARALLERAASHGQLASVIHTAGISPQMSDAKTIMQVNALGTVNVVRACYDVAGEGFALINVASMAAHMVPSFLLPKRAYPRALTDSGSFLRQTLFFTRLLPTRFYRSSMAYCISKNFVVWLSKHSAGRFGEKGARILSVSPGSFDTEMGRLEEKSGSAEVLKSAALQRFGRPEEIADLLVFAASDKASYLTGTDILCDGGVIAGREHQRS